MRVKTIRQFENDYYVTFGYNGAQFNASDEQIAWDVARTGNSMAHDSFVVDASRYSSIPTPKFDDCKFQTLSTAYSEEGRYRIYTLRIQVTWQHIK